MDDAPEDPMLTVTQAAQLLGVSRATLWRWTANELPYETTPGGNKRAGRRRYRRSDVLAALERPSPTSVAGRVRALEEWRARHEALHTID